MRVRMNQSVVGLIDGNRSPSVGDEIEVSDEIGASMVRKGQAEPVAVIETRTETRPSTRRSKAEKRG